MKKRLEGLSEKGWIVLSPWIEETDTKGINHIRMLALDKGYQQAIEVRRCNIVTDEKLGLDREDRQGTVYTTRRA